MLGLLWAWNWGQAGSQCDCKHELAERMNTRKDDQSHHTTPVRCHARPRDSAPCNRLPFLGGVCACQAGVFELQWLHSLHGEVTHLNTTMNPAMKKNIWMM